MLKHQPRSAPDPFALAVMGAGLAAAGLGFALRRRQRDSERESRSAGDIVTDAPNWTLNKASSRALFGKSILINRPRAALFAAWRIERFPEFMENVVAVTDRGDGVSEWTVKAPAGQEVMLLNRITETTPGEAINWQSEPQSDIANSGQVRFTDAPAGRGTYVSLILAYEPPGGKLGRMAAKWLQREPEVQARRDLHRFKQLMETGEITSNASPSARKTESPIEPHI